VWLMSADMTTVQCVGRIVHSSMAYVHSPTHLVSKHVYIQTCSGVAPSTLSRCDALRRPTGLVLFIPAADNYVYCGPNGESLEKITGVQELLKICQLLTLNMLLFQEINVKVLTVTRIRYLNLVFSSC
jgi:hypothetical protein